MSRDAEDLRGETVLVTGAAGFIGAGLVERLVGLGCTVAAVVRPGSGSRRITDLLTDVELIEADIVDLDERELFARVGPVSTVFHLAAAGISTQDTDVRRVLEVNTAGTLRVLEAASAIGCRRLVYCGSCFEYGGGGHIREDAPPAPLTVYGASKAAGWLLAETFGRRRELEVVGVRPFTAYGPGEAERRLVPYVIRSALQGHAIKLTAGNQRRDFVYRDDVVDGLLRAAVAPDAAGEAFNLCTGEPVTVAEVATIILTLLEVDQTPELGAQASRVTDVPLLSGDPHKARGQLGWVARTSLADGLSQAIDWHRGDLRTISGVSVQSGRP